MPVCQYSDWAISGAVWRLPRAATSASRTADVVVDRRPSLTLNWENVQVSVASQTTIAAAGRAGTMAGPTSSARLTRNVNA